MDLLKDFENADTISIDTVVLEEQLHEERAQEISELNALSKKVCHLHTSLLYYRNSKSKMGVACYEAWRTLLKKVGGTPDGWRDLGYFLGIAQDDLNYILNSMKYEPDPANVVLKIFMQDEDSTLDKVLNAFVRMQRYDILKAIEQPLSDLAQYFNTRPHDSGYHSNSKNSTQKETVSFTKELVNDLPPALLKNKDPNGPHQPFDKMPIKSLENKISSECPILFLTYATDGLQTADNIQRLVSNWSDPEVTVITLSDRKDEVHQNPEKFIRDYVEMADFVVPIVSTGYINVIKSQNPCTPSSNENLDVKFVKYIYNLINGQFIANGCMNKNVRGVLPENTCLPWSVTSFYPILTMYTCEADFEEHFKVFLKKQS